MFENQTCMYFHCFSSLTFPRNANMTPPRKWRVERQASPLKEWFAGSMVPLVVFPSLSHQNFSADQRWGISSSWLPARQRCIMRQVKGQKSPSVGGNSNSGWNFSPRMSWGFMIQFDLRRFFKWVEVNHQLDQGQQKTLFLGGAKGNPLILPHLVVFFLGWWWTRHGPPLCSPSWHDEKRLEMLCKAFLVRKSKGAGVQTMMNMTM